MNQDKKSKNYLDLLWALALIFAGVGVFIRLPEILPSILENKVFSASEFFIKLSFYLMGILLIGGGLKKIWKHFF